MKVRPVEVTRERLMNLVEYAPREQHLEVERYDGSCLASSVEEAVERSEEIYILETFDGLVTGLTGYSVPSIMSGVAWPFCLSTVHRKVYLKDWLKVTKLMQDHYATKYNKLVADIDAQYGEAVRWMRWLGYELHGPYPMGPKGSPFYRCTFRR